MSPGNGSFASDLPPRLDEALRAARAGHYVSIEALEAAVCLYIGELIVGGHEDQAIRLRVVAAFRQADAQSRAMPGGWSDEFIDQMIARCRDRLT